MPDPTVKPRMLGRLPDETWDLFQRAAQAAGKNRAEWATEILERAARAQLGRRRKPRLWLVKWRWFDGSASGVLAKVCSDAEKELLEQVQEEIGFEKDEVEFVVAVPPAEEGE